MKVKTIIKELEKCNPNAEVCAIDDNGVWSPEITITDYGKSRSDNNRVIPMTQTITAIGEDLEYFDAFHAVKDKGGLPSNRVHDEVLKNEELLKALYDKRYYTAWCNEMLANPKEDAPFPSGDFRDSEDDYVFPAKYIPKDAIGKKGIGLIITPKDLVKGADGKITVIPKKILVRKIPQKSGLYAFDEDTRLPNGAKPKGDDYWDARYLWRRDEQTLRPLVRWDYDYGDNDRRHVHADWGRDSRLGVGFCATHAKRGEKS